MTIINAINFLAPKNHNKMRIINFHYNINDKLSMKVKTIIKLSMLTENH